MSQIAWEIVANVVARGQKTGLKPLQDIYKDFLKSTTFSDQQFRKSKALDQKTYYFTFKDMISLFLWIFMNFINKFVNFIGWNV